MTCANPLVVSQNGNVLTLTNNNTTAMTVTASPAIDGFPLTLAANGNQAVTVDVPDVAGTYCYDLGYSCEVVTEPCTGLFDCAAADVVVNNGNPITCPSTVPLELNWVDCNGDRVTTGFQGLQTDLGDSSFTQDLGNGRNLYTWNIFGGSTTGPTTATFTYGDPNDLCTFTVLVPACEVLDKQTELLSDPNRCGYGENATGGTNLVEVSTEAEFFDAIAVSGNYVCLTPALANTTFVRNTIFSSFADNLTIDGSLAPGFKIQVGPGMPQTGFLFRFWGDNIIIHDIEGVGLGETTTNSDSFLNLYGNNIWIDKVTARAFDDDSINILLDADNITVSRSLFDSSKSVFVFNPNAGQGDTKVAVHSSWMDSIARAPWISAGMLHSFNNLIQRGESRAGRTLTQHQASNFQHSDIAEMISQNNVFENQIFSQALVAATEAAGNEGYIESIGDQYNGASLTGNVTQNTTPTLFNIPYDCDDLLKPTTEVKAYVQSTAGAS